jgi:hypothetical protein
LKVFVASSTFSCGSSGAAAGSDDAEADTGACSLAGFSFFLSKPEGTSPSTFLLLTEDIAKFVGFGWGLVRSCGRLKYFLLSAYRILASDWLRKSCKAAL